MDVTQNNWILPVADYETAPDPIREQGMQIQIDWEPAVIFNSMNQNYWPEFFETKSYAELLMEVKLRGLVPLGKKSKKVTCVDVLVNYYREMFS